jgi:hypothetical protein
VKMPAMTGRDGESPWSLMGRASGANRVERRLERIRAEIARNRRGEYTVPTWVLATILATVVAGWVAVVLLT